MDETSYQLNLLSAMNHSIVKDNEMYQTILETAQNAFIYYHYAENRTVLLGNWSHFFPFPKEDYKSISQIMDFVSDEQMTPVYECLTIEQKQKRLSVIDFKMKEKNIWVELETRVIYNKSLEPVQKIFCFKDITKFRIQNEELSYMAYYDTLTGLLNRNYFIKKLNTMIGKAKVNSDIISLLFIDIDDFRKINDGMGIIVGDEVVQQMGQILKEFQDDSILISHFNSDTFCMAVYDSSGIHSVEHIISSIKNHLADPLRLSNHTELQITVSIGVAEYPEASDKPLELVNCAEIVMFKAKHRGKNNVQYFDAPIINEFISNIKIEHKLVSALKSEKFFMYYQPQFDTNSEQLRGFEALIRWRDDDNTLINPAIFIPLAEKNGIILPLGEWIIEKSISDFSQWYRKYNLEHIILSINISALQFKSKEFVSNLINTIQKYDIPSQLIELEITESVFIDDMNDIVNKMNVLRGMGFRFSMDDFGTGFSSLSYLRNLPIDTLKIDKSFIDTVVTDEPTRTIAESIINLGKKLGFETIAEGVEEKVQVSLLKKIGCENIQGFYFGKPMDKNSVDELLMNEKNKEKLC